MRNIYIKFILILLSGVILNAYELPKIDVKSNGKPKVVLFVAESVVIKDKPSYILRWKTINANHVMMTFIGKIPKEGSLTITKEEYEYGPITITASSDKSTVVDSKTINKQKSKDPQVQIIREIPAEDNSIPAIMPYRHRFFNNPWRNRRIY